MKARDVLRSAGAFALLAITALLIPAAAGAEPPTVSIDHPGTPSITTVPVSGHVDAHGIGTIWTFEVSTDGVNWTPTNVSNYTEANGSEPVSGMVEGLSAETEYEVRLGAFNFEESVNYHSALTPSFTTDPAPNVPSLALNAASAIGYTGAHLSGSVNPEGGNVDANAGLLPIFWELQYAPVAEPGSWQPAAVSSGSENPLTGSNAEGNSAVPVEADAGGLKPGTEYNYRLVAHYAGLSVATPEAEYGHFTTTAAAGPTVSGLAATETQLSGFIDTGAPGPAPQDPVFKTQWEFTCTPGCSFEGANSGTIEEPSNQTTEVTAVPKELLPNQPYTVTLHASNGAGEDTETLVEVFTTQGAKPDIGRETLWEPTATSIQLNALVNAHNSELTDCHFEYGTTTAYGSTAPCEAAESIDSPASYPPSIDNKEHIVSARIVDLQPATEYHFRLVAGNSAGMQPEDDRSFTTLAPPSDANCQNEGIREAQHATALPDCRAWEKVSPADKGGGDIVGDGFTNLSSGSGDAVTLSSRTPFGDTVGSGVSGQTQYVAHRTLTGWIDHSITPPPRSDNYQTTFGPTRILAYSDDLSTALVYGYDLPYVSGALPLRNNIYAEDTATRGLQTVTARQGSLPDSLTTPPYRDFAEETNWGMSADGRHIAFVQRANYTPQADPSVPNLYQWDEGRLSLAGILPDGSVPPGGSSLSGLEEDRKSNLRWAMSRDGSRQLFRASQVEGGPQQLFQRIDGTRTVWISEPELATPSEEPSGVGVLAATPDGRSVFFVSQSPLLEADTNGGPDLYRWTDGPDPQHNLTMIPDVGDGQVVGISDDGQRLYYQTPDDRLVFWENGLDRKIAQLQIPGARAQSLEFSAAQPGAARVSSAGRYLAFFSDQTARVLPNEGMGLTGRWTKGHIEMYLYDSRNDTLRCASCPDYPVVTDCMAGCGSDVGTAEGIVAPLATSGVIGYSMPFIRPRYLDDSGQVFFSTPERLVASDVNGTYDAYQYDAATGQRALLSSGRGGSISSFTEADPHGNNVFIVTRQQLTLGDKDELVDLYAARVGGGFEEAPELVPAGCTGESCQPSSSIPTASQPASSAAQSQGNVHSRRCGHKGRRRSARGCRKRHGPHPRRHHRSSGKRHGNGRTGR